MITLTLAVYDQYDDSPFGGLMRGPEVKVRSSAIICLRGTDRGTTFVTLSNPNTKPMGVFHSIPEIEKLMKKDPS